MIIRTRSDHPYAMVPRNMLLDGNLSLEAKGLMAYFYARYEDEFTLISEKIVPILHELEKKGYVYTAQEITYVVHRD